MSDTDKPAIHPDFDGHLEYSLRDKTPDEKLAWLEMMMELQTELRRISRRQQTSVPSGM
ncbi:hypothetical protein [Spirochaeta africana]|uniref:PH domain-containing protein n=1 Tax=Spirochaeta africana (strain ATCC 700263 / DSM 8902 / Z-7692) TaxID=889378 RepID=H9UGF1_SPIAZ|nr:hypothetical protein [Spirochaeta africana]AFG36594.1 hypothetical protein Spiaf_0491 [Spirochaeta africana DSM 8902]